MVGYDVDTYLRREVLGQDYQISFRGCVTVVSTLTSDTHGPQVESSDRQI